jgi:hypothetical protein
VSIITLTKHAQNIVGSDVPPCGGAGAPEIELTQGVVDAGLCVLLDSGALYHQTESYRLLVEDILKASLNALGYGVKILEDRPQVHETLSRVL